MYATNVCIPGKSRNIVDKVCLVFETNNRGLRFQLASFIMFMTILLTGKRTANACFGQETQGCVLCLRWNTADIT